MSVSFQIDVIGVRELVVGMESAPQLLYEADRAAMNASVHLVEGAIKARTPRRTGRLFSSIQSATRDVGGEILGIVSTPVSYAEMVESGTRPHEIAAVNAMALMLPIGGWAGSAGGAGRSVFGGARLSGAPRVGQQVAFFRRVHHPGTKGQHMFEDGLMASEPSIQGIFQRAAQRVVEQVART